ncbi:MAG: SH3 domain-containing protein, partial [Victivallales bacterium]|nr:SH3 domain-containing protein [Victivallales bacterium]
MYGYMVLLLLLLGSGLCAQTEKFVTGIVDVDNKLNVRVKPGKQYYIVSTLKKGDTVKIFHKVND